VIKAQVLAGGRGKAGAIRAVASTEQAESAAREILAMRVKGFAVKCVMVAEWLDIRAEYYAGITIDRETKSVVLIVSAAGGMDIEDIAAKEPQRIRRLVMAGPNKPPADEALSEWLSVTFSDRTLLEQAVQTVQRMYRLLREKDCSLVEINPLAVCSVPVRASQETPHGVTTNSLVAADAKIIFDDNGVSKHPDVALLGNPEEYTPDELEAKEAGLSFVSLDGEIGCMVNGAGLAMATMDGIKLAGGSVANFLDVGGSSDPQKVVNAFRILLKNEKLKLILVNIFGGITRCDDVAQGILTAREQLGIAVPVVIRLIGTNEQKGRQMLTEAGMIVTRAMTEAVREAVRRAKGGSQP
jgi:succinyl-CoA synthetase beta subunit